MRGTRRRGREKHFSLAENVRHIHTQAYANKGLWRYTCIH